MSEAKKLRIRFSEPLSGWGNPLVGRVFDSDTDLDDEGLKTLHKIVNQCDFKEHDRKPGDVSPKDVPTFMLSIEMDGRDIKLSTTFLEAEKPLRELVSFLRTKSRRGMLE